MNGNVHVRFCSRVGVATSRLRQRGEVRRSPHQETCAGHAGPERQANLPAGNSTRQDNGIAEASLIEEPRCGKTARRDLCGGRRVTGRPYRDDRHLL